MPRISVLSWTKAPSQLQPSLRNTYSRDTLVSPNAQLAITLMLAKTRPGPKAATRGSPWLLLKNRMKLIYQCKMKMPRLKRDFSSSLPYQARNLKGTVILTFKLRIKVMLNSITIRMLLRCSKTVKQTERGNNSIINLLMGLNLISHTFKTGKGQLLLILVDRIRVLINHLIQSNQQWTPQ